MTHEDFINKYSEKYVDYDGAYGAQCVDLMRRYCKDVYKVDGYVAIPTRGNAKDIFKNFQGNKYFKKILNTPKNVPQKGDIIFWGFYPTVTGLEGHVAIYHEGDVWTFTSIDQNYPKYAPCRLTKHGSNRIFHGYRGVMGWLRRK
jgi:hypothetical protein